jgi:hypothetical protein
VDGFGTIRAFGSSFRTIRALGTLDAFGTQGRPLSFGGSVDAFGALLGSFGGSFDRRIGGFGEVGAPIGADRTFRAFGSFAAGHGGRCDGVGSRGCGFADDPASGSGRVGRGVGPIVATCDGHVDSSKGMRDSSRRLMRRAARKPIQAARVDRRPQLAAGMDRNRITRNVFVSDERLIRENQERGALRSVEVGSRDREGCREREPSGSRGR